MNIEEISLEREKLGVQMQANELFEIAKTIIAPSKVLVFGLGNDSILWNKINKEGRTVFIEDNPEWYSNICDKYPFLEAYLVDYKTKREEWRDIIDKPDRLLLDLPEKILNIKWDIILVDAPAGYEDGTPGRMKSIYMASLLIRDGGDIFVHDSDREIEKEYSYKYLLKKNLVNEVRGIANLRHFKIVNRN